MHQVLAPTSPSLEVSSPEVPSMTSSVTSHDIRDVLYRDHVTRQMSGLNSGSSNFMMKQQGHNMVPPQHDFPYMTPFFYHLQQAFIRSQQQQQTSQKMVMDSLLQQSSIINEHRKNLLSSFIHQLPPSFHHFQSGKKFHPYGHNGKVMMMMMSKDDESKMESETGEDNYEGISGSPRNKKNLYSPSCAGSDVTTERNSPLDDVKLTSSPFKGRNWLISDEERIHSSNITCPVCRLELNPGQMQLHLLQEMQQLKNTSKNISLCDSSSSLTESRFPFLNGHCTARGMSCKSRYETFARVRNNRETRLAKIRKSRKRSHDQMSHPLIGQQDDGVCNGRPTSPRDEDETIDVISVDDNKENDLKSEDGRYSTKDGVNEEEGSSKDVHSFACPLCLSIGQNPTISTGCWHLMCEPCWKKAVSAQEKCPQCDAAVGNADLRRIYI